MTPKTRGNNLKIKLDIKTQGMILIQPLFTWSKWNLYLKLPFYFEIPPCEKLFSLVVFHGIQNPIFSKRSPYQLIIFVFSKNYKLEKWISFAIGHFWKTKKKECFDLYISCSKVDLLIAILGWFHLKMSVLQHTEFEAV